MQGFYRNHMEEVIKFFETHHKVSSYLFITCLYSTWQLFYSLFIFYTRYEFITHNNFTRYICVDQTRLKWREPF